MRSLQKTDYSQAADGPVRSIAIHHPSDVLLGVPRMNASEMNKQPQQMSIKQRNQSVNYNELYHSHIKPLTGADSMYDPYQKTVNKYLNVNAYNGQRQDNILKSLYDYQYGR